jgi:phage FluMu gp28-like protein
VFLDEFAYLQRAAEVWDSAAAVTMLPGLKLRVCSTPNGVGNDFYELWHAIGRDEKLGSWKKHEVDIDGAMEQGYPVDLDKCWSLAKGDPRLFSQLFRCAFLDGELQYIPTALVEPCLADDLWDYTDGACYAGLDVGKEADKTALVVLRLQTVDEKRLRICSYIETRPRTDSEALDAMVDRAFEKFELRKLCIDSTGLGSFPAERIQKRFGSSRVEPVTFTLNSKESMATALYTAFSDRSLLLPRTDAGFPPKPDDELPGNSGGLAQQLRLDISSLQRIITTAGNVRYDAPRTSKGHADSAWALALALHAAGDAQPRGHLSGSLAAML